MTTVVESEYAISEDAPIGTEPATKNKNRFMRRRWVAMALLFIISAAWYGVRAWSGVSSVSNVVVPPIASRDVSALGRLAPEGEVIAVAPPTSTGNVSGARVDRLLVAVGDDVTAGQVVAVLDTQVSKAAYVLEATAKVEVAKAKLAQVSAGPKLEDVAVQEAIINRATADEAAADREFDRGQRLAATHAIAHEDLANRKLKLDLARATLAQNVSQLESLKLVRPVDIRAAEAEVASAQASLTVAETELRNTEVRVPLSGKVLSIKTRPGEKIGDQGLLDVGHTQVMESVAEVYEEDANRVQVGQRATIRVPTLGIDLAGAVVSKDLIVSRKIVFSNDPVADIDARVVEVRIRLIAEDSARVAGLSNARAEVVIKVDTEKQP